MDAETKIGNIIWFAKGQTLNKFENVCGGSRGLAPARQNLVWFLDPLCTSVVVFNHSITII